MIRCARPDPPGVHAHGCSHGIQTPGEQWETEVLVAPRSSHGVRGLRRRDHEGVVRQSRTGGPLMSQDRAEGLGESNRSGPGWIHLGHLGHRHRELHN